MPYRDISRLKLILAVARGEHPADLLISNVRIINVFNGCIEFGSVAIFDGLIVGFGDYDAIENIDLNGAFLAPGLIEGHIHIESSRLTPRRFAEVVAPHGTTTVIADPHEIANVYGLEGIRYMIHNAQGIPVDIFYMLPSCVPATNMETSGAALSASDLKPLLYESRILGIAELMNFPGAYLGDDKVLSIANLAEGKRAVDGHSPGLTGKNLSAYLIAGPSTDHECNTLEEAKEKLSLGMRVMIREGSASRNLDALISIISPLTERRCMLVSDDRHPGDLIVDGHLDRLLSRAVETGVDPVTAIRMVTLNVAETYNLNNRGGIRPGWLADLVAFDNLEDYEVIRVWKGGKEIARNGKHLFSTITDKQLNYNSLNIPPLSGDYLDVPDSDKDIRMIGIIPDKIITKSLAVRLKSSAGLLQSDVSRDIAKLSVIDRHSGTGRTSVAFVQGLGLKKGALASTVAHDSHNLIVAGVDDVSMQAAISRLREIGGGQIATDGQNILAELALPIGGLMSDLPGDEVAAQEKKLLESAGNLGSQLKDPFITLSFLALPVIPELKLTDHGLVDVNQFKLVSLYI